MHTLIRLLYHKKNNCIPIDAIIVISLSLWLLVEAGIGILQILGIQESNNPFFIITGHFINPGPYGGFIATLVAICSSFFLSNKSTTSKWMTATKYLAGFAATVGIIILPSSMSRASWFGLFAALSLFCYKRLDLIKSYCLRYRWIIPFVIILAMALGAGGFLLKRDSALGRLHIWHIECRIISKHPITGIGRGKFAYEYGMEQARFFREKERSKTTIRIAGCPEYAFNEYLKAGVEFGVIGLILSIIITITCCVILTKKEHPLGYGCVVLAVFAFFSYPMEFWPFQFLAIVMVTGAFGILLHKYNWAQFPIICALFICITVNNGIDREKDSFRTLYQQGHVLFLNGYYKEALPILEQGSKISSDPMFHNIMGQCYVFLGNTAEAEQEFMLAHYMVPCRLYPLVLLQELYISQADTMNAKKIESIIKETPINPRNENMKKLLRRAEENMLSIDSKSE